MAKVTGSKVSFNAGELSPLLNGRVDIAKYANGCTQMTNFIPAVQGPAIRRPGTRYVTSTKNNAKVWLQKFEFNYQQSFVLEFGANYIRFFFNHGYLSCGTPTAWSNATAYVIGDLVRKSGINYYAIQAGTNQDPATQAAYWYALTDDIYEIPTTYSAGDLTTTEGTFGLSLVQSGDVIYIAHRGHKPAKLSRFGNTNWQLSDVDIKGGVFDTNNTDTSIKVTAEDLVAAIGDFAEYSITLTASSDVFTADLVGALFQLQITDDKLIKPWASSKVTAVNDYCRNESKYYICEQATTPFTTGFVSPAHTIGARFDGDYVSWQYLADTVGIVRITAYTSPTEVTATVIRPIMPVTTTTTMETWAWSTPAWTTNKGYPTYVTFFRERLVFARDNTVWFSVAGDYENFSAKEFGEILDDSAITAQVPFDTTSQITYLVSTKAGLIVGSTDGEALIGEGSTGQPFSPSNYRAQATTAYGSRVIKPVKVDGQVLFVQKSGKKVRESAYDFDTDNIIANDVTILAEHITYPDIVDMAFHREPYSALWCVRSDGALIGFTYNKAQEVTGWHKHTLSGEVEAVQVIPRYDGTRDDLWVVVKRIIDGNVVRYVEYMERDYQLGDAQSSCYYVDAGATYSGAATTTISGLDWLEGETVQVLTNGATHPDRVVTGGVITLQRAATIVQVGLGNTPLLQLPRFEGGSQMGSAQGKAKRISRVNLRVLNSLGIEVGSGLGTNPYQILDLRRPSTPMGVANLLATGDYLISYDFGWEIDAQISITSSQQFPITIISVTPDVSVNDR